MTRTPERMLMASPVPRGAAAPPADRSPTHSLLWGVKRSWNAYIGQLVDGRSAVDGGAERCITGDYRFPLVSAVPGRATFAGALRFEGHYGMLAIRMEALSLVWDGTRLLLTATTSDGENLPLVELQHTDSDASTVTFASRLTPEGSDLFLFKYPAGADFDPVRITASIAHTVLSRREPAAATDHA